MSSKKLLYSKRYPDYREIIRKVHLENELAKLLLKLKKENPDLVSSIRYIPNPERQESKQIFAERIIDFSEKYNLDIDLFEGDSSYVAYLYVPTIPYRGFFKAELMMLIHTCDESYFSTPDELEEWNSEDRDAGNWTANDGYLIVVIYRTHDIFIGDKEITDLDK